ncbi:protein involved in polysaccharide export with SLBB domain [Arcicella aurantiaca]|uniref:Protein involved in polysaccharide export with SLBB domain n=1 Tax=Arcicella aurantiaca TaxID=591202 RepID=A0A316EGU4_9BACT|nr:SLBB domain-containing protein [Arcicella aurantiaca]PWK28974.1 protein involved in polysaccharide export with SLBB domain [Arcicella aurantiaca]
MTRFKKNTSKIFVSLPQLAFFLLLLLSTINAFSQKTKVGDLTDEQVAAFLQKAKDSGMSEAQIEKAAIMQGYTPADVAKMRERLNALVSKKGKTTNESDITVARKAIKTKSNSDSTDTDSLKVIRKPSKVFGMSMFASGSLSFEPDLRIATPRNYQLGPDDELNIDIFGNALDNYKVKVSPEGTVRILNLSPIYVNGLTIESASERIVGRLRQLYQGINMPGSGVSAQITLGNVRSIKVTITGEVVKPGTYTVSSLATVFNALYAAGGPSENGSFRNIKVIRDNKIVRVLDLYDFLLRADQKDNIRLQDQDVIRIADYETRVEIIGEVKRPMIFEVEKTETLKDVLRFAGGFTDKAYTYTIGLRRNTAKELKLLNITQDEVSTFIPQRGDKYTVGEILERFENRVQINGAVFRSGEYALEAGVSTVKELIKKAEGLKEDAFLNRATINRQKGDSDPLIIAFDLGKLMKGEIDDIPLKREDIIFIKSIKNLREKRLISISGEVNKEGKFDYVDGLTLADVIVLANGFSESASYAKIELARRVKDDTTGLEPNQDVIIKSFDIDKDLKISALDAQITIQPFDKIYVRKAPRYVQQKTVVIEGEVKFPGAFTIKDKKQRITDLIELSGGLKDGAFAKGASFSRDSTKIAIDLSLILKNPDVKENLLLIQGDRLFIPRELETIKLTGELLNPISVPYRPNLSIRDYISQAGGFTEKAAKRRVFVKYANGFSDRTKTFLFFTTYPKVEQGAEIIVPAVDNDNSSKLSTAEKVAILGAVSSISLIAINIINALK